MGRRRAADAGGDEALQNDPDDSYSGFCGRPDQTLAEIYRGEGKVVETEGPNPTMDFPRNWRL